MQLAFDFFGEPLRGPVRAERLFFAIFPDEADTHRIEGFRQDFLKANQFRGSMLREDRFHVSLHHVGDFKRLKSPRTYAAELAGDTLRLPTFDLTFHAIESFGAIPKPGRALRYPLVLRCQGAGLFELHGMLGAAMAKFGMRAVPDFIPHLTLAYGEWPIGERRIDPIVIRIAGFSLVHSRLWKTEYRVIKCWSLIDAKPLLH